MADTEGGTVSEYDCWMEVERNGTTLRFIARTTFLIGPDGVIQRVWTGVKPDGHAQEVLEALGAAR